MRKVMPYKNHKAALKAVDNGGRFYNLLTKADDGLITSAELARAAGVYDDASRMHLFLEMSLYELAESELVKAALSAELKQSNLKHTPLIATPSQANRTELIGKSAIVTGIPHYTTSNTKFEGFIMIPVMTNNVMTLMMIPIFDEYDVYELRDESTGDEFLIAHARSKKKLPAIETRVGGFLKELKKDENNSEIGVFLEACYYTPL